MKCLTVFLIVLLASSAIAGPPAAPPAWKPYDATTIQPSTPARQDIRVEDATITGSATIGASSGTFCHDGNDDGDCLDDEDLVFDQTNGLVTGKSRISKNVITLTGDTELTAAQLNSTVIMTAAGYIALPDVCDSANGKGITLKVRDASEQVYLYSLNTSDIFTLLDGTALDANDKLALSTDANTFLEVICDATNRWNIYNSRGTPTDGGLTCRVATDYIGTLTNHTSTSNWAANRLVANVYTPTAGTGCASGNLKTAYLAHNASGGEHDRVKLCIYSDDGDSTPNVGDLLIGCTGVMDSTQAEVVSASIAGAVTIASPYWIVTVADTTGWTYDYTGSGKTMFYQDTAGAYANPPANLDGTWNSSTTRQFEAHVTVGP